MRQRRSRLPVEENPDLSWALGATGSAPAWHAEGYGFEFRRVHARGTTERHPWQTRSLEAGTILTAGSRRVRSKAHSFPDRKRRERALILVNLAMVLTVRFATVPVK